MGQVPHARFLGRRRGSLQLGERELEPPLHLERARQPQPGLRQPTVSVQEATTDALGRVQPPAPLISMTAAGNAIQAARIAGECVRGAASIAPIAAAVAFGLQVTISRTARSLSPSWYSSISLA